VALVEKTNMYGELSIENPKSKHNVEKKTEIGERIILKLI
jgi:hypothetical protein